MKETKVNRTDPDSGVLRKNEKEKCFAYSFHTACDRNGFILGITATAANIHDSTMFETVLEQVKKNIGKPEFAAVDAGYKTPYNCRILIDQQIRPVMPYTRPMTKDGFFKKYEYVYDEYYDCYICPNNQILEYRTTNREGYREYKSDSQVCTDCLYLSKCTNSKDHTKLVTRHIWAEFVEEAEHLRHTDLNKEIYARRKETIERVFADMKEKHGMRWTTLRGLKRVSAQAMLVAACMNLKKMANWMWRSGKTGPNPRILLCKLCYFIKNTVPTLVETVFVCKLSRFRGLLHITKQYSFICYCFTFYLEYPIFPINVSLACEQKHIIPGMSIEFLEHNPISSDSFNFIYEFNRMNNQ